MAGTQFDPDDDDFDDEELEGSNLVKQLRKQLKDQGRENTTLKDQLGKLSTKDRQRTLSEALTAKGLSDKAAKFYPADAELDDAAIAAWISDNADVFGKAVATTDDASTPSDPGEGQAPVETSDEQSFVDPVDQAAFRRMQAANLVGTTSTTRDQEVLRGIQAAKTPEELTAFIRSAAR